ncbi:hypothetical protein [Thermoflexus sp.]|uniref:hypothetical protein n=1 Tax=Thermoflexus sp. TaxID=1969742 RepID=UPI0035E4621E
MRRHLETGISLLLALAVVGVGCGICLLGTLAVRGDISWTLGGAQYRMWLIREREGVGLALSQTVSYRGHEGTLCQRTSVWFWLWTPRLELQSVDYQECTSLPLQGQTNRDNPPLPRGDAHKGGAP